MTTSNERSFRLTRKLDAACEALARVRELTPRIHCLTNTVVQDLTANGVIALGCVPSMSVSPSEMEAFAASVAGGLINLGTLDDERRESALLLARGLRDGGRGLVIDPVFCDSVEARAQFARQLIQPGGTVIRVNERECLALAGRTNREEAVRDLSERNVLVVSGSVDLVQDHERHAEVFNGTPLLASVTGTGCLSGAMIAAFLAVEADAFIAALGATLSIAIAGEIAAMEASGPGSFRVLLIDALAAITPETLKARARIA